MTPPNSDCVTVYRFPLPPSALYVAGLVLAAVLAPRTGHGQAVAPAAAPAGPANPHLRLHGLACTACWALA